MNRTNVRTFVLPHGGSIDIPLPGSKASFAVRQSPLALAETCPSLLPTVMIPLVLGLVIGVGATAWWMSRK